MSSNKRILFVFKDDVKVPVVKVPVVKVPADGCLSPIIVPSIFPPLVSNSLVIIFSLTLRFLVIFTPPLISVLESDEDVNSQTQHICARY